MMKSGKTQTYRSSFEAILCDQSTQTDESFHEEVVISRSPEEEPPKKKSPKKFHHLVKIHLMYHQNMMNCQMTPTTWSPSRTFIFFWHNYFAKLLKT